MWEFSAVAHPIKTLIRPRQVKREGRKQSQKPRLRISDALIMTDQHRAEAASADQLNVNDVVPILLALFSCRKRVFEKF